MEIKERGQTLATSFDGKCVILSDLWLNHRDEKRFEDYVSYSDLGLPLAYAISNGIVEQTSLAENFVDEAWTLLLSGLGLEDTGFDDLYDIIEEDEDFESDEEDLYNERTVEQIEAEAYNEGYSDGFKAEQRRIQEVVTMHKRWAKENKKGNEYIFWDSVGEVLTPIEIDYSEEAYRKSLEEDGF